MFKLPRITIFATVGVLAIGLTGCSSYDYFQHTERVGYKAGNAVKYNLELQTVNPSKKSMNNVTGLGKNGDVTSPQLNASSDTGLDLTAI